MMSDTEFAEFCAAHPDYFIEMTAEGELIIAPPNYSLTGARNQEIGYQLGMWAKRDGRGIVTEASSGFVLPNGARRSPDAAWTSKTRLQNLDESSLESFWHLCPDFVIELRSHYDRLPVLRKKMGPSRPVSDNLSQRGTLCHVGRAPGLWITIVLHKFDAPCGWPSGCIPILACQLKPRPSSLP